MNNQDNKRNKVKSEEFAVLQGQDVAHLKEYDIFKLQGCIHPSPDLEGRTWMITQRDKFTLQAVACPIQEGKPNAVEITLLWPKNTLDSQLLNSFG